MNQVTVVDFLLVMLFSWLCLLADGLRNQEFQTSRLMTRYIFHQNAQFLPEFLVPHSHRQLIKQTNCQLRFLGEHYARLGPLLLKD